ncbi:hypothetical protein TKK_0014085 [Trichogramma kaykai]
MTLVLPLMDFCCLVYLELPECIGRYTEMAPQTRSSSLPQLTVPDSSSEVRRRSFSIMGARVWNELPLAVRNVESLPQFPRRLRAHLASCR